MIYAKIDVLLPRHHRMQAIDRASALGIYLAAICYSREHELDGFVPLVAFRGFPSHSKKDVDELLRVGLFETTEREGIAGILISKYGEKNETKEAIEVRRAATRERVTRYRKSSNAVTNGVSNASVPGSLSVNGSSNLSFVLTACPDQLPAEWRAAAEMLGVRDVDDAWTKFHLLLKSKPRSSANWASEWEMFYRREKTFQAGGRGSKREVQKLQGEEPWLAEAKKAGMV